MRIGPNSFAITPIIDDCAKLDRMVDVVQAARVITYMKYAELFQKLSKVHYHVHGKATCCCRCKALLSGTCHKCAAKLASMFHFQASSWVQE